MPLLSRDNSSTRLAISSSFDVRFCIENLSFPNVQNAYANALPLRPVLLLIEAMKACNDSQAIRSY